MLSIPGTRPMLDCKQIAQPTHDNASEYVFNWNKYVHPKKGSQMCNVHETQTNGANCIQALVLGNSTHEQQTHGRKRDTHTPPVRSYCMWLNSWCINCHPICEHVHHLFTLRLNWIRWRPERRARFDYHFSVPVRSQRTRRFYLVIPNKESTETDTWIDLDKVV